MTSFRQLFVASIFFFLVSPAFAALSYGSGVYTNMCGTGLQASANTCNKGCNPATGSCSAYQPYVVKYTCAGKVSECRGNESGFATSQSVAGAACGTTVQIDVFTKNCRTGGGWQCADKDLADYMVWYAGDCNAATNTPTPSMTPRPSTTPTATPRPTGVAVSSCDELTIVSGNDSLVPATVTLRARGSDNQGNIQWYRFSFGDGTHSETSQSEVKHTYGASGEFLARVEIKDSKGNWKTSDACHKTVKVKPLPVETHKSACSDLYYNADNTAQAPSNVQFTISGYDNKGSLQGYKIEYGDGKVDEGTSNTFTHRYETAGTYTAKSYIKDSKGNWQGGENSCRRTVYIATAQITKQPNTGTPTILSLFALSSGAVGVGIQLLKRRFS